MELKTCVLCGAMSLDVRMAMIRWRDGTYGSGPRCHDVEACFRRVLDRGDEWLIYDGRQA